MSSSISSEVKDYPHLTLVRDKKASGFSNDINQSQFDSFIVFKKACKDQKLIPNFNYYDDYYLLKFCRARKFDLEKVLIMFKNFLKWREKENVDKIDEIFTFDERLRVKKIYPHGYHKTDKLGRPIYIELISKINLDELFKTTTDERLIKYYVQEYERLMKYRFPSCSKRMGKIIDQSFTILDLEGIGVSNLIGRTRKFLSIATKIGQDYYPENMGIMFLINTSSFFTFLLSIVKKFLDPKTVGKIQIEGKNYRNKLLEFVHEDDLPNIVGGNCTCSHIEGGCLFSDIGPWNPIGGLSNSPY